MLPSPGKCIFCNVLFLLQVKRKKEMWQTTKLCVAPLCLIGLVYLPPQIISKITQKVMDGFLHPKIKAKGLLISCQCADSLESAELSSEQMG